LANRLGRRLGSVGLSRYERLRRGRAQCKHREAGEHSRAEHGETLQYARRISAFRGLRAATLFFTASSTLLRAGMQFRDPRPRVPLIASEPRIDGLALQRENAERALVNTP